MTQLSRRDVLAGSAAALALSMVPSGRAAAAEEVKTRSGDGWRGLKVGVATYTFRKFKLDEAIKGIGRAGMAYCSIKDFHLPMKSSPEERKAVAARFREAGITPVSVGVVSWKNDEAEVRRAFEYARDAGVKVIVCNPHPDSLPAVEKLVKEFDVKLAIHNHGPEDKRWPGPYNVMKAIEKMDPGIGLCIDVGHTARAGIDPAEAIERCRDRLIELHIKDIAKLDPKAAEVECGRGVLDVKGMVAALLKIGFAGHVAFEHEKDPDDPLPGLSESAGYVRGVLASL